MLFVGLQFARRSADQRSGSLRGWRPGPSRAPAPGSTNSTAELTARSRSGSSCSTRSTAPGQVQQHYRAPLDHAPWPADEQQRMIDEVLMAYRLTTAVLAELGRDSARYVTA